MTLRHFKVFVTVCDAMNMTAAAESLFMSQSAVSQTISELEKHYAVRLFERFSRKLFLTLAGEKLLGYARHIIRMNSDVESDMKTLRDNGSIRIGASVTVGTHVLPKLVVAYKKINSAASIQVFEDNTEQIEKMILNDQIDVALVEGDIKSKDILCQPFMNDELILICAPNHRFTKCSGVKPCQLQKENFIIREKGSGTRKTFEDVMAANNLSWNESWTCNNADTIKMAVAEGLGISVISGLAVQKEMLSGILYKVDVQGINFMRLFKIVYHKNKYLTNHIKKLIDLCFEYNQSFQKKH